MKRPHLLVCLSGHGYGHLGQTAPVLNLLPHFKVSVASQLPAAILDEALHNPYQRIPRPVDVGLAIDDPIWDHSTFSKNRDRLLEHQVVEGFFAEVLRLADQQNLLSKEHFSVDGTLIQAWASQKSFRPKDGADDQRPVGQATCAENGRAQLATGFVVQQAQVLDTLAEEGVGVIAEEVGEGVIGGDAAAIFPRIHSHGHRAGVEDAGE